MKLKKVIFCSVFSYVFTLVSCDIEKTNIELTKINLNQTSLSLGESQTFTLTTVFTPKDATKTGIKWTSDNEEVATVDASGLITAKSKGTANIYATSTEKPEISVKCTITVSKLLTSLNIPKNLNLAIGGIYELVTNVSPKDGGDTSVTWLSDNTAVVTVDEKGRITPKAKGTANIIVTSKNTPNLTEKCEINVVLLLYNINLNNKKLSLNINEKKQLITDVYPKESNDITILWKSDNEKVAVVDENGIVTATGSGISIITAYAKSTPNLYEKCEVVVKILTTSIGLSNKVLTMEEGEEINLTTDVKPKTASDTTLYWSSDNEEVAFVDTKGKIVANAKGFAKIMAVSKINTSIFEICEVTVNKISVKTISQLPPKINLKIGQKETLNIDVTPSYAFDKSFTWKSSDSEIASVVNGVVYGLKEGTVTITAQSVSNPNLITSTEVTVKVSFADILSFKFEKSKNPGMSEDVELNRFNENNYGGNFKYIANNKLIPTFTVTPGATVTVNGETQISGTTVQDFTSAVNYIITSSDGITVNNYRIALNVIIESIDVVLGTVYCKRDYLNKITTAILADSMNGEKIIEIGEKTFSKSSLQTLTLPNSLLKIGRYAFYRCDQLINELILPNKLQIISEGAFLFCPNLNYNIQDFVIPNSVTIIEKGAFAYCFFISGNLTIGSGLKEIHENAFAGTHLNSEIIFPPTLTYIGREIMGSFCYIKGDLIIPNSVTSLQGKIFQKCIFSGKLTIGSGLTELPNNAFEELGITGDVIIPANIKKIGNHAFKNCWGIKSIKYKKGTIIDYDPFYGLHSEIISTYE